MEYLSFIIGVIGGSASVISLYLVLPKRTSWRTITKAVKQIVHKTHVETFKPDLIILYGRGGAVFGGLLAGNLGNVKVTSIDRNVINDSGHLDTRLINANSLNDLKTKSILLVTGEVVTGSQLSKAVRAVRRKRPKELKTCAFYVCRTSSFYPDYYYKETNRPINVPWRILKDYKRTSKLGFNQ